MRALLLALPVLLLTEACQSSNDLALPNEPAKRQRSLSERILDRALYSPDTDPAIQSDVALAVSEVVLLGHVPHLRMIVSGNYPILARGAARALVRVRLLRDPKHREAILQDCIKTETNSYVKEQCVAEASPKKDQVKPPNIPQLVARLESDDAETRRAAAREVLAFPELSSSNDDRLLSALYHGLLDSDARFRLLVSAIYLRRSIASDPFAMETGE